MIEGKERRSRTASWFMTGTESAQAAAKRCGWRDSGRRMGATRRLCGPNLYHHDNLDNVISSDLSQVVVIVLGKVPARDDIYL